MMITNTNISSHRITVIFFLLLVQHGGWCGFIYLAHAVCKTINIHVREIRYVRGLPRFRYQLII